eukprot:1805208-Rhodomonas_salina.2
MSGTDRAYGAISRGVDDPRGASAWYCLSYLPPLSDAMSGTDLAYAATPALRDVLCCNERADGCTNLNLAYT